MALLKLISERANDYDVSFFVNELVEASKYFGIYEAKLETCQMDEIVLPILHLKEAVSSMDIEGTEVTTSMVFEEEVSVTGTPHKEVVLDALRYANALVYAIDHLKNNGFSHKFICKIHEIMLSDNQSKNPTIGKYKTVDNQIVNSAKTVVFTPPSHKDTRRYMNELIDYMNCTTDNINPLIKAAIIHSQFESIHPFQDGNGRVGRILISLYLYKAKIIRMPYFYISEALNSEKVIYYSMLTSSRGESFNEWIKFFLKKCIFQTQSHITYIDNVNTLYSATREKTKKFINTTKYEMIVACLFKQPILTSQYLSNELNISLVQAKRYLTVLSEHDILVPNDRIRNTSYAFIDFLNLLKV